MRSLTSLTLLRYSEVDFAPPREREAVYQQYIDHLMRCLDGYFTSHSRFPYVVFNPMMRQPAHSYSTCSVNQFGEQGTQSSTLTPVYEEPGHTGPAGDTTSRLTLNDLASRMSSHLYSFLWNLLRQHRELVPYPTPVICIHVKSIQGGSHDINKPARGRGISELFAIPELQNGSGDEQE